MKRLFSFYKTRKLRRGITLNISPSFKCNLKCPYCLIRNGNDKMPEDYNPMSFDEWTNYIENFQVKISEVNISGGSPELNTGIDIFINNLLHKGYHVSIASNLKFIEPLLKVKKSYRFCIYSTFHHCMNKELFLKNYNILKKRGYQVEVSKIDEKYLPFSILKPCLTFEGLKDYLCALKAGPDGVLFINTPDMVNYYRNMENLKKK